MKGRYRLVVCGIAFSAALMAQPFRLIMIHGESMSPTYKTGQLLLTARSASGFQRGQAVVFDENGETLVKRIAFLPGDRILEFKYIGQWVVPPNDFMLSRMRSHRLPSRYITIPPDHLYVLGDNASESIDSRVFGPVPISDVLGRVMSPPHPELISGFAGAAETVAGSSKLTSRKVPLSKLDLERVRVAYRAGVD